MRFEFKSKKLQALFESEKDAHKYPVTVVDGFFEVMDIIDAIKDINVLRTFRGLNFEKLKGNRKEQYSVRLNKQYRLIIELQKDDDNDEYILIIEIVDYH